MAKKKEKKVKEEPKEEVKKEEKVELDPTKSSVPLGVKSNAHNGQVSK